MSQVKQANVCLDVYAKPHGLIARRPVVVTGELAAAALYLAEVHPALEYSVEVFMGDTYLFEATDVDHVLASVVVDQFTPVMQVMEELIIMAQSNSWYWAMYDEEHETFAPDRVVVHGPDEPMPF